VTRRRWPSIVAGGVIIAAGFGVALVETYRFPKGTLWLVVGVTVLLVVLIRWLGARNP
jgi:hypothetical protein